MSKHKGFYNPFISEQMGATYSNPFMAQMQFKTFDPYQLFTQSFFFKPWEIAQHSLQTYFSMQQKLQENTIEWVMWQQMAYQQSMMESARWLTHCMQLTNEPQTLFRYLRMNWQKPYLELGTQAVTSSKLLSHMWTTYLSEWQQEWLGKDFNKAA